MKIDIRQIPPEGLNLTEEIASGELDLETGAVRLRGPVRVEAQIRRITNAVSAEVRIAAPVTCVCSRCLGVFEKDFKKDIRLAYQADNSTPLIDLNPDIRDEIMLDYPIKPLCKGDCRGLCAKCGADLNKGKCSC